MVHLYNGVIKRMGSMHTKACNILRYFNYTLQKVGSQKSQMKNTIYSVIQFLKQTKGKVARILNRLVNVY